jgi:hypothetical protein
MRADSQEWWEEVTETVSLDCGWLPCNLVAEPSGTPRRRVVVTGLGTVTPLASDIGATWSRLLAGEGSCAPLTAFALDGQPVQIACEASEFEPSRWLTLRTQRRMDRFAQFAVAAAPYG